MYRNLITIALLAGLMLASSCNFSRPDTQAAVNQPMINKPQVYNDTIVNIENDTFSPNTLIISYDIEAGTASLDKAINDYGAEVIYRYDNINAVAIRILDGKDIHEAIQHFSAIEGVTAVNRDRKMRLMKNH